MWNDQTVEALKRDWNNDGLSAEAIAQRLTPLAGQTVTKNMVVGKARRLKLTPRKRGVMALYVVPAEARAARRLQRVFRRKRHAVANPHYSFGKGHDNYTPCDPTPEVYDAQDIIRVAFIDREDGQCGWPIGDPKDKFPAFGCCGEETAPGVRYCARHAGRSVEPPDHMRPIVYKREFQDERIKRAIVVEDVAPDVVQVVTGEVTAT